MAKEDARPGFWSTLPGLLTGIAALITAVVGALIAFGVFDRKADPADGGGAGRTTPAVSRAGGTPPASSDNGSDNFPPTPTWQNTVRLGTFVLGGNALASLETGTSEDVLNVDFAIQLSTDKISLYTTARPSNLSPVDDPPDAATCATILNERKSKQVEYDLFDAAGQWLCVQTKNDHVGAIRIRSASSRQAVIEYVLWRD